jgi:hypothetical protein
MRMLKTRMGQQASTTLAVVLVLAGTGMAGCARSRPSTAPTPVALNVPPPPPRVISTPPEPVAPTEATTLERPAPARPVRTNRPAVARNDNGRNGAEATRVEAVTEPAVAPVAPEPAPAPAGPLLRTPQTADETEAARRTRDVLGRAKTMLERVAVGSLGTQAQQQHATALRFVEQAEQAMVDRNFVLATYLADKAETLAKGLSR